MRIKKSIFCVMMCSWTSLICAGYSLAAQDDEAKLSVKPAKTEPAKTTPKGGNTKATGGAPKKPAGPSRKPTVNTPPRITRRESNRTQQQQRPRTVPTATIIININPSDSQILIDGQEVDGIAQRDERGAINIKPGTYQITARKPGYGDEQKTVTVTSGQSEFVRFDLRQLPGRLTIAPNVEGAEINIRGKGSYAGRVTEMELAPGRYEVTINKSGYQTEVREVYIEPGLSHKLMVALEALRKPAKPDMTAMALAKTIEGKYVLVSLIGSSSTMKSQSGSIDVTLGGDGLLRASQNVKGVLPGYPCRVDLIPLENVGEFSFKETPELKNGWEKIVVRIRPKKADRAIRFLINWQAIGSITR
jgi:hypothetical protein